METKKLVTGTLVGGIVYFFLGFIFYAVLFQGFFEANTGGATGFAKTEMAWWPLILGNLAYAALLSYVFLQWAHISSFGAGLKAGAIIGFFVSLSYSMIMYDTTLLLNLTAAFTDVILGTVMSAVVGGVVGAVLGMGTQQATAPA